MGLNDKVQFIAPLMFVIGIGLVTAGAILDWNICHQLIGSVQFDSCSESNNDNPTHILAVILIGIGIVSFVSAMLTFYFIRGPKTDD